MTSILAVTLLRLHADAMFFFDYAWGGAVRARSTFDCRTPLLAHPQLSRYIEN
jgi:hypothetical protein